MKLPHLLFTILFLKTITSYSQDSKNLLDSTFQEHFDQYRVKGSVVINRLSDDHYFIFDEVHAKQRFSPASTFKIFNSLAALETGVAPDTSFVIRWDSVKRGSYPPWHRDNSLKSAFRYSVVWYYRELARRIGEEKMQDLISKNHYGNESIRESIDGFWLPDLGGQLRISQMEQIDFLKKLFHDQLLFSKRSQSLVKGIMLMEENSEYKLYAKTGMCQQDGTWYGWYVGWVQKQSEVYFFATHVGSPDYRDILSGSRNGVTLAVLKELGFIQ